MSGNLSCSRRRVITEAETWLSTPYHHMARVKGGGVDCLMLVAEVYAAAGVVPPVEIPFYPPDWHLHRGEELYMNGLLEHAREIAGPPQPGDIALFKFGRCFSHGAIVVAWPLVIHAWHQSGVVYGDATQGQLADRKRWYFDPF